MLIMDGCSLALIIIDIKTKSGFKLNFTNTNLIFTLK